MTMKFNSDYKTSFRILKKGRIALCISIAAANFLIASPTSNALPTNGTVVNGNIAISQTASNMTINQSSNQGIINWGTFNIGANATVRFNQPNVNSSTLNRVTGGELSQIAGNLSANGRVILINPNGVIFNGTSRVDVGGIVASTYNLSDANYLNGNYHFTRDGEVGKILNQGNITTTDEGFVALLAPEIQNEGVITARKGTVAFASGDAITLDFAGNGLLNVEIDPSTVDTLIENKALVEADGGYIYMSSKAASDAISSTISNTGTIQANGLEERDGKIILFAHDGTMNVDGTITAKGGFIETSGESVKIANTAKVTTLGNNPTKGEWLIDPTNFTISAGSGAQTTSGIGATTLEGMIAGNALTTIVTDAAANGSDLGDIIIDAPLSWSANTLSLSAHHSVLVNNVVTVSGTGGLTITTNTGNYTDGISSTVGYLKMKQNRSGTSGTDTFDGKINWSSSGELNINSSIYAKVSNQTELEAITGSTKYFLVNDIALTGTWTPLTLDTPFSGTLDGLGHTISALNTATAMNTNVGLFAKTSNVTLQNLGILNSNITGVDSVGALIGEASGSTTLRSVFAGANTTVGFYNDGTRSNAGQRFGGLVGYANSVTTLSITDSYNAAAVKTLASAVMFTATPESLKLYAGGGIVSYMGGTGSYTINNVANYGTIIGGKEADKTNSTVLGNYIGGLFGYITAGAGTGTSTIANSRNYGAIYGQDQVGGIIGYGGSIENSSSLTLQDLRNEGSITGQSSLGGIAGALNWNNSSGQNILTLTRLSNRGTVFGTQAGIRVGGIVGILQNMANFANRYVAGSSLLNSGSVTGGSQVGGIFGRAQAYADPYQATIILNYVLNTGTVNASHASSAYAGGLIGYVDYLASNSTWTQFINLGTITSAAGSAYVGNIAGAIDSSTVTTAGANMVNSYGLSGAVVNNNIFGYYRGASNVTAAGSTSQYATKTDAELKDTLANLSLNTSYWGGGGGVLPYLKGFTTPITITIGALSKTYGSANPTISYSDSYISGITWGSAITQWSNAGTYAYTTANMFTPTFTTGNASDYTITWATTNSFTINPYVVSLTGSKVYDGTATTAGGTITVSNALNGDTVNVTNGGTAGMLSKNVGSNLLTNFTGLSLSNSNYTLAGGSGNITVSARPITISTSNVTKTYDGGTSANGTATATTGSLASGDTFSGGTYAFTDKNAGTGNKTVTVSGVTVNDGNSGSNYTVTYADNIASTINKKILTVIGTKEYDGSATFTSGLTLGGFVSGETVGYSSATANSKDVVAPNNYLTSITLTDGTGGGVASNYQISGSYGLSTNKITTTAKSLTLSASKVYNGSVNLSNTVEVTISGLISGESLMYFGAAANDKNVATANKYISQISLMDGANGEKATNYQLPTLNVANAPVTITTAPISITSVNVNDKVYDGTVTAAGVQSTVFSGKFGADDVNVAGTLGDFTSKDVGTYSISITDTALTGTQASNYYLTGGTTFTDSSVAITPKTVTLVASKVYDGTTSLDSFVTLGGFVGSETLNYTGATVNDKHVATTGKYINAITLADGINGGVSTNYQLPTLNNTNASVTITAKTLTPTLSNAGVTKSYDGDTSTAITPTYTVSGFVDGDSAVTITNTSKVYNDKDVADANKITVSGLAISGITGGNSSAASDYALSTTTLDTTATITKKTLTIAGLTADNKTYDGTTDVVISNWGGVTTGVGSETLTLNHGTASFGDKNKADGKTVTAIGYSIADGSNGGAENNYQLASTSSTTTANIIARIVTLSGSSGVTKVYDGLTSMPIGTSGYGTIGNGINGDDLYVSGAPVFNSKDVATASTLLIGSVALAGSDANNYALNWSNGTGTISKATLTVKANNDAKFVTYNDVANFNGVSYSGFVNGETTANITTTGLAIARTNTGIQNAGTYNGVLVASGLSADNYQFNYTNGDFTIVPAGALLVRANSATTTYATDATYSIVEAKYMDNSNVIHTLVAPTASNNDTTFTYSDGAGGTASFTLGAMSPSLSGAGKLQAGVYDITATNVSETSNNFSNNLVVVGALTVDKKAVTVGASNVSKVYDGTTSMNNLSLGLNGVESGDTVAISGNGTFTGKDVGTGKTYTVGSLTLGSTDSSNYYLSGGNSMSGNDGEITKKTVHLSATKTYDGNGDLTGFVTIDTGVTVGGLSETLTYSDATASSSQVATSNKYISAIVLGDGTNGGLTTNYQLATLGSASENNTLDITAREITLTADAKSKTYGENNPSLTYQIEQASGVRGLVNSDTFTGSLATTATQYSNVGDYDITSTLANSNYDISYVGADLTISKRDLSVIAQSDDKIVGETDPIFQYTANGFVGSDNTAVLNGLLSRETGITPGDYMITRGTLDAQNYSILFQGAKFTIKSTFIPPVPPKIEEPKIPTEPTVGGGTGLNTGINTGTGGGTGTNTGIGINGGTGINIDTGTNSGTNTGTGTTNEGSATGTNTGTETNGGETGTNTNTGTGTNNEGSNTAGSGTAGESTTQQNSNESTNSTNGGANDGKQSNESNNNESLTNNSSNSIQQIEETKNASFDGLLVGNTASGQDIKAIVINDAPTSATPVTMLVNVKGGNVGFSFSIPSSIVSQVVQTSQNTNVKSEVTTVLQADGKPLPSWISFDKGNMNFSSTNVPEGGLPLTVKVMVSNGEISKTIEVVIK